MRVSQVIHGYPPHYEAGSEVYTRTISQGLVGRGHEVHVFARIEDPFRPDYGVTTAMDGQVRLRLVNHARDSQRFHSPEMDAAFAAMLDEVRPDVVHIGHLSHLSMGLPAVARSRGIPVIMTLHDFWLCCPRGQFLQWGLNAETAWPSCSGQEDAKCATQCYNRMATGRPDRQDADTNYWTTWVAQRMQAARNAVAATRRFP